MECQGPVWSPEGQLPYKYFKNYCKWHVNYLQNPPPLSCCISFETRAVQGSERLLGVAFLWI